MINIQLLVLFVYGIRQMNSSPSRTNSFELSSILVRFDLLAVGCLDAKGG